MNQRLTNALLYVLQKRPGSTVAEIQQLLYRVDFQHYREHLSTVTGATYHASEHGPAILGLQGMLLDLECQNMVRVFDDGLYISVAPDPGTFNTVECAYLDKAAFTSTLDLTPEEKFPWSLVFERDPGAQIPPALFRWQDNMATDADLKVAQERHADA